MDLLTLTISRIPSKLFRMRDKPTYNYTFVRPGDSLLHVAARAGLFRTISVLVESGLDVNKQNEAHETPLFCAMEMVYYNHHEDRYYGNPLDHTRASISHFLNEDVDPNIPAGFEPNSEWTYPLTLAAHLDKSLTETLLDHGADVDANVDGGLTVFESIVSFSARPRKEVIAMLLKKKPAKISSILAYLGSFRFNERIVSMLLKQGADPFVIHILSGQPVYQAAFREQALGVCNLLADAMTAKPGKNQISQPAR